MVATSCVAEGLDFASKAEFASLQSKGVFELVDSTNVPKKPITSKADFRRKRGADGKTNTYKVRFVARGFTKQAGEDYHDTYAPTCSQQTFAIALHAALYHGYVIHQVDVETAYLDADLEEEIYMRIPKPYAHMVGAEVVRLRKALYGLNQSGRAW